MGGGRDMGGGAQKGRGTGRQGRGQRRNSIQLSLLKSHFLQSQIIVFIEVEGKKKGRKKKAEAAHWADGALVFSLLSLMVINYYYPAVQGSVDVMSPMSLGWS